MPSDASDPTVAVFDLGGTWFRWGCYSASRGLLESRRVPALNYLAHPRSSALELQEAMLEFILTHLWEMKNSAHHAITAVGVSVGAPVNVHNGTVLGSGPLWGPSAGPFPLHERLRGALPELECHVVNDITALLARYMQGDVHYSKTMLITVSSGVGSRLFDHRNRRIPYEGEHGVQGEIGHLVCPFEIGGRRIERRCECGGWNHLNAFASGRGIAATLKALPSLEAGCADLLADCAASWEQADDDYRLTAFQVALAQGRGSALALLEAFVTPLVRILATALTLDPEIGRIVMTGGVVHGLGTYYRDALQRVFLREELYQITAHDPAFLMRRLHWEEPDDFSGLRGAGLYAVGVNREGRNGLSN